MRCVNPPPPALGAARFGAGEWIFPQGTVSSGTSVANGQLRFLPIPLWRPAVLDAIGLELTTAGLDAGCVGRVGLWLPDSRDWLPSRMIAEAAIPADGAPGFYQQAISVRTASPIVWASYVTQNVTTTGPQWRGVSGASPGVNFPAGSSPTATTPNAISAAGSYTGSLPATISGPWGIQGSTPRVYVRVAS